MSRSRRPQPKPYRGPEPGCLICDPVAREEVGREKMAKAESETYQLDPAEERELDELDHHDDELDWTYDWWLDWKDPPPDDESDVLLFTCRVCLRRMGDFFYVPTLDCCAECAPGDETVG